MKKLLNVGDVIIEKNPFCTNRNVVERVTKTLAICGNIKYIREYEDNHNGKYARIRKQGLKVNPLIDYTVITPENKDSIKVVVKENETD